MTNIDPAIVAKKYPVGSRVEMIYCADRKPIEPGTVGTVSAVDSVGTVHVYWDNGRALGVVLTEDRIRKIS